MRLQLRIFLWLLPALIGVALVIANYYAAHRQLLIKHIAQHTEMTLAMGARQLNYRLSHHVGEIGFLSDVLNACDQAGQSVPLSDQTRQALSSVSGYSAIVVADSAGQIEFVQLASSRSNRYILPQAPEHFIQLPESEITKFKRFFLHWQAQLADLSVLHTQLASELNILEQRKELHSQRYSQLQAQYAVVKKKLETPPVQLSYSGGQEAVSMGLPYSQDTFVFYQPRLDCDNQLMGIVATYLDRSQLENMLYELRQYLNSHNVSDVEFAVADDSGKTLLTETRLIAPEKLAKQPVAIGRTLIALPELNGYLAAYPVADAAFINSYVVDQKSLGANGIAKTFTGVSETDTNLRILAFVSQQEFDKLTSRLFTRTISWGGVLLALLVLLLVFLARHISKPLVELQARVRQLRKGEKPSWPTIKRSDEIGLLMQAFERMATALEKKEKDLVAMASIDPLTDCLNRRAFIEAALREQKRAQRTNEPMVLLMFDLDHFKQVNDHFGHAAGDQVLKHFAALCFQQLRGSDLFGRYGGEEFVVALPNTEASQGIQIAERIRKALAVEPVSDEHHREITITVSVGLTLWAHNESLEEALGKADDVLYQAKHRGRNQVQCDASIKNTFEGQRNKPSQ